MRKIHNHTSRLSLYQINMNDFDHIYGLMSDPIIMKHFPKTLSKEEVEIKIKYFHDHYEKYKFSFYSMYLHDSDEFVGIAGCKYIPFESHFTPAIEVGWMLKMKHWKNGYAFEAAKESMQEIFAKNICKEIVAITNPENHNSTKIMEKLAMKRNKNDDFLHPDLKDIWPEKKLVLYRISKNDWDNFIAAKK